MGPFPPSALARAASVIINGDQRQQRQGLAGGKVGGIFARFPKKRGNI